MEKNIRTANRVIRIIAGLVLLIISLQAGFFDVLLTVLLLIGIILIVTGILGYCPLYSIIKKSQPPEVKKSTG